MADHARLEQVVRHDVPALHPIPLPDREPLLTFRLEIERAAVGLHRPEDRLGDRPLQEVALDVRSEVPEGLEETGQDRDRTGGVRTLERLADRDDGSRAGGHYS